MSDDPNVNIGFDTDGSEDQLAAAISQSLAQAFAKIGPQLGREFAKNFQSAFGKNTDLDDIFTGAQQGARRFQDQLAGLEARLEAIQSAGRAQQEAFGQGFNPKSLDAFNSSLEQIAILIDEVGRSDGEPESLDKLRVSARAVQAELTATRTLAQQATLAAREETNNQQRDLNQASRERLGIKKAETARFVVETQTQAAREVAILRTNAQQQVALAQATAKRRAATFALVATAVRSTERVIRSTFETTSRVVSASLNGITRTASSAASAVGNVFRRGNRSTVNNFNDTTGQITNSYNRSFRRNTSIVNNELGQQQSRIRRFAEEATQSIGSIGVGRLGGFAALGVAAGKALTGGFERATTLETSERGLSILLGSAEEAKALLDEVVEVVTGTPFRLDQFAEGASRLVAFNVEAERIPDILTAVGDAAALSGKDAAQTIDTLIRVTGQATATGKLYGDAILQLGDAGIPALRILGNAFNKQTGDIQEMLTNGVIPAEKALDALFAGIVNGTDGINGATAAFGGLAKGLGDTLSGSLSNFNIAFSRLGANLFKEFTPAIISAAKAGTAAIDLIGSALASVAQAVQSSPLFGPLQRGIDSLGRTAKDARGTLKPFFDFIAEGIVTFATAVGAIAAFAGCRWSSVLSRSLSGVSSPRSTCSSPPGSSSAAS